MGREAVEVARVAVVRTQVVPVVAPMDQRALVTQVATVIQATQAGKAALVTTTKALVGLTNVSGHSIRQ